METKCYSLEKIGMNFFYGSMPKEDLVCDSGYPIFSGYRYTGYYKDYNISKRSLVVIARGVGGTGDVRIAEAKTFLTNLSIAIDIDTSIADIDYLNYYMNLQGLRYLDSGAAQSQITINSLKRHKVFLPELNIQKGIVNILSTYDSLIELNTKRIKTLEQMAENLYKEWFVRFRFPGHENAEFENGIPKGWVRERISIYYNTTSGGTPSRSNMDYYESGVIPWIKTGEIKDSIILDTEEHISQEAINKSSAKLLPPQIVIMAMYGVNIGMLSYVDKPMSCNQACCAFIDKRNFSSRHYLFHYLKTIREYLLLIGFGAAQQNLSQDLIKNVRIIMPSDEIVKAFEETEETYYQMIRELLLQNTNLVKQRDLLLPRLMSGKLEV